MEDTIEIPDALTGTENLFSGQQQEIISLESGEEQGRGEEVEAKTETVTDHEVFMEDASKIPDVLTETESLFSGQQQEISLFETGEEQGKGEELEEKTETVTEHEVFVEDAFKLPDVLNETEKLFSGPKPEIISLQTGEEQGRGVELEAKTETVPDREASMENEIEIPDVLKETERLLSVPQHEITMDEFREEQGRGEELEAKTETVPDHEASMENAIEIPEALTETERLFSVPQQEIILLETGEEQGKKEELEAKIETLIDCKPYVEDANKLPDVLKDSERLSRQREEVVSQKSRGSRKKEGTASVQASVQAFSQVDGGKNSDNGVTDNWSVSSRLPTLPSIPKRREQNHSLQSQASEIGIGVGMGVGIGVDFGIGFGLKKDAEVQATRKPLRGSFPRGITVEIIVDG
eukprot:GHVR01000237.1.p1 GENE.GHVR01000237.1~~GHVR01000237.1.p1  ORF type:complete len:409 (+),score=64.27 GHVR01000237.1:2-1228(+)